MVLSSRVAAKYRGLSEGEGRCPVVCGRHPAQEPFYNGSRDPPKPIRDGACRW